MTESPRRSPRVSICVPAHDQVATGFTADLARLVGWSTANLVSPGHLEGLQLNFLTGTLIHTSRQRLAEAALEHAPDYILWIDSDMRFPADSLHRLLAHREQFVGINYSTRGIPPDFTASKKVRFNADQFRVPCVTSEESTGLEAVEAMGFGMVLIRYDVFAALPEPRGENRPWFWYDYCPDIDATVGEDVYFCRLAREAGFTPYVDHDLSKECKHVGTFEYRVDHVTALQEADEPDSE